MKRIVLIATTIATAALMTACQPKSKTVTNGSEEQKAVAVKTVQATKQSVAQVVDFTANLEPYKKTFVTPAMAVRIEKIYVEVGNYVKQGQLMADMDKNQYKQSELQLKNSEINLARLKAVYEAGGTSKQQIDELETSIGVMRETIDNLKENLELRSPISGVVTGRYNEPGDLFTMGANAGGGIGIFQVMQIDRLKAKVAVPEQYFRYVKIGMPVKVKADIFPELEFDGRVSLIYPSINSSTRTFDVEVTVPNDKNTLRPGMFARTTFNMGERESVVVSDLAVSRQAGTNDRFVYVIGDGKAEYRPVVLGRQVGNSIEILSGLSEGESVAVAGLSRLTDGAAVTVNND